MTFVGILKGLTREELPRRTSFRETEAALPGIITIDCENMLKALDMGAETEVRFLYKF